MGLGLVVVALGLVVTVLGHVWNAQPLPRQDGANIGAAGLELLGIVVLVIGLVMVVSEAGSRMAARRRSGGALPH
jgi:hypothetical protein